MAKCYNSETLAIDYVYGELNDHRADDYEKHLSTCEKCRSMVNSYKQVLHLVDEAEAELTPHALIPNNLQTKLYRKLAEVPPAKYSIGEFLLNIATKLKFILREQKAASICLFATTVVAIALFIGRPFPTTPNIENQSDTAFVKIEQYRNQDIQRSMEDVIRNRHLRYSDTWDTVSQLNRVKDQAQGTDWANIAKQHLKSVNSEL